MSNGWIILNMIHNVMETSGEQRQEKPSNFTKLSTSWLKNELRSAFLKTWDKSTTEVNFKINLGYTQSIDPKYRNLRETLRHKQFLDPLQQT